MLRAMPGEVTLLLNKYKNGDSEALNALATLIYPELKAMARRRTPGSNDVGATVLVNETFLKLLSGGQLKSADRQQFFGLAATVMRQVIVDEVRHVTAQKRKGEAVTYTDSENADKTNEQAEFLLEVDKIVAQLAKEDPRLAQVFECRYFAGFSTSETAEVLGVSERTAERLWSGARERIAALMDDNTR
jgi:RNA polymerase sigma factor (TIGR02999 family)